MDALEYEIPNVVPPGMVVNRLRGDADEPRAHAWLAWDGSTLPEVAVLGVPFDGASVVRGGSRDAPDAVRQALAYYTAFSSSAGSRLDGLCAADIGDIDVVLTDMPATFARITQTLEWLHRRDVVTVCIGGDHSIAWPILRAVTRRWSRRRVGVIHFDEHHDLREAHFGAESSGVPFRKALTFDTDPIHGPNLVQIGLGEFANSPVHARYAKEQGVTVVTAPEVFDRGIDDVVAAAQHLAGDGTDAIYVSVDVNVIDQAFAPGTAAPNGYGLDARDVYRAVRTLGRNPKVVGLDIVEISPPLDIANMTGNVGAMLVLSFLAGVSERAARRDQAPVGQECSPAGAASAGDCGPPPLARRG